jgi:hypothetical protein
VTENDGPTRSSALIERENVCGCWH